MSLRLTIATASLHALVLLAVVFCFGEPGAGHALVIACLVLLGFAEQRLVEGRAHHTGDARLDAWMWAAFTLLVLLDSPLGDGLWLVGGALMLVGLTLRVAAIRRLGMHYRDGISPGPQLVVDGVYRWGRHPGETGLSLVALGAAVAVGSASALALWILVMVPIAVVRARREDRALALKFGERYARYISAIARWSTRRRLPQPPS